MGGLTGSQIDALGRRLRDSAEVSADDLGLLQELLNTHIAPLQHVNEALATLALTPHSRLKSTGTIVDKLRRERVTLRGIRDLAGTRVVKEMTLSEQDDLTASVSALFPDSRVIDRRAMPNHGYRAVHVAARVDGRWVEIQLRTTHQDTWAQLMENLADHVGRWVRYGRHPAPGLAATMEAGVQELVAHMMALSQVFAEEEELRDSGVGTPSRSRNDDLVRLIRRDLDLPEPD